MTCPKCRVRLSREGSLAWCGLCAWEHPESGSLPEPHAKAPGLTYRQRYYRQNREAERARAREHYRQNRERILEQQRTAQRSRYQNDPEWRAWKLNANRKSRMKQAQEATPSFRSAQDAVMPL